jgi:multidrug efflux pump subunit AcrB
MPDPSCYNGDIVFFAHGYVTVGAPAGTWLNQKLAANLDLIPPGVSQPLVKPRSIDDVPMLALTFWSKRYGYFELRRIAAQVDDTIKQTPDVSAVALIGGQHREIRITLNQAPLAAYSLSPVQVVAALGLSNRRLPASQFASGNQQFLIEAGQFLRTADDVRGVVAGVASDKTILVRDVAEVTDGGEDRRNMCATQMAKAPFPP